MIREMYAFFEGKKKVFQEKGKDECDKKGLSVAIALAKKIKDANKEVRNRGRGSV